MSEVGRIPIPAASFAALDGTAGNLGAVWDYYQSTHAAPSPRTGRFRFDKDVDWNICTTFDLPSNYVSDGIFKFGWHTPQTRTGANEEAHWKFGVAAISESDVATILNKGFDALAECFSYADANANELIQKTITLNMDGASASDFIIFLVQRNGSHIDDTVDESAYFLGGELYFTSSG